MTLARFQMCIGGEWVDALSGKTFESLNPASAQAWAELPDADEADVERAVQAAQTAFDSPAWRGLTATARGKLLRRLGVGRWQPARGTAAAPVLVGVRGFEGSVEHHMKARRHDRDAYRRQTLQRPVGE